MCGKTLIRWMEQTIAVCHHDRQVGLSSSPTRAATSFILTSSCQPYSTPRAAASGSCVHSHPPPGRYTPADYRLQSKLHWYTPYCVHAICARSPNCASELSGRRLCRRQRPADCFDTPCTVFSTAYFDYIALAVLDSVHTIIFVIIINISCSTAGKQGSTDAYD